MMSLFIGKVGNGKTYSAVLEILRRMSIGIHCFSNINLIRDECIRYCDSEYGVQLNFDELYHPLSEDQIFHLVENIYPGPDKDHPNLVVIDEAPEWFDSRSYQETTKQQPFLHRLLRQSRKLALDFIFICQHVSDLDKKIRGQIASIWNFFDMRTINVLGFHYPIPQIYQKQFHADGKTLNSSRFVLITPYLYNCYNSYQLLREIPGLPSVRSKPGNNKKVSMISRQYFHMFRMSHLLIMLFVSIPVFMGCNRARSVQLKEDLKTTAQLKNTLEQMISNLQSNGIPRPAASSLTSAGVGENTVGSETVDHCIIVKRVWSSPYSSGVILADDRILKKGSQFGSRFIFLEADEFRIRAFNYLDNREVLIPIALYDGDSVPTNMVKRIET